MRRRRAIIPQRVPIFFGCEGESERAYGQILNDLLRDSKKPFHLEAVTLNPGAGDPIARILRADQEVTRRRPRRSDFSLKVILMDSDQVANAPQRREEAERLAQQRGIRIIWQVPCHEAFLLRHLTGFSQHRPATAAKAEAALRCVWPQYCKPMTKVQLAKYITLGGVRQAAAVEPSLSEFLRMIALLP